MTRLFRCLGRLFGSLGMAMLPPTGPCDLGFVLPRPDLPPAGYPADRFVVPLSAREEEAFRVLTSDLAR